MNCSTDRYTPRRKCIPAGMTAPVGSMMMCLSLLVAVGTLRAQPAVRADSLVALVRGLYEQGSYLSSEVEARRLLDNRSLPDSLKVRAEQYLAFSLVAQAKNAGAVDHFVTILRIDSTFTLDPILTSPKILSVFSEAHRQYGNLKLSERSSLQHVQRMPDHNVTFRTDSLSRLGTGPSRANHERVHAPWGRDTLAGCCGLS